jgi:universal stress protein A
VQGVARQDDHWGLTMFEQIVAGWNGTTRARQVVDVAAGLAKAHGARLHLVWAYRQSAPMAAAAASVDLMSTALTADHDLAEQVEQGLEGLRKELARTGIEVETYPCCATAPDALLEVAKHQSADLIVVGDKGMHGARRVLGSTPNSVAHGAGCAVLIVPTGG